MLHGVVFFIAIILLLLGLWLFNAAVQSEDPVANSQKRTWSFVAFIIGFFLLLLCAGCYDQLRTFRC